jgi:ankyrin repeat protein
MILLPRSPAVSPFALLVLVSLLLGACGEPTPEEARKKLAERQVAPTPETLLAQTKTTKTEDTAKLLVQAGVDPNARQPNGMTVLMSAAFNGQLDVAEALLKRGADVKAHAAGYNALGLAAERDNKDMVKLLLAHGASPTERPPAGLSALERAQARQNAKMVDLLGGK